MIRYYQPHLFSDNNNAKNTAEQSSAKNEGISEPGSVQVVGGSPVVGASSDAAVEGLRRQLQGVIELHRQWLVEGTDEKPSSSSSSSLVAVVAGYLSFLQALCIIYDPTYHCDVSLVHLSSYSYRSLPSSHTPVFLSILSIVLQAAQLHCRRQWTQVRATLVVLLACCCIQPSS